MNSGRENVGVFSGSENASKVDPDPNQICENVVSYVHNDSHESWEQIPDPEFDRLQTAEYDDLQLLDEHHIESLDMRLNTRKRSDVDEDIHEDVVRKQRTLTNINQEYQSHSFDRQYNPTTSISQQIGDFFRICRSYYCSRIVIKLMNLTSSLVDLR